MEQWATNTLEYTLVKEKVKEYAFSAIGKKRIEELMPTSDPKEVRLLLQETEEGMHLLRLKGDVSLSGFYDIHHALRRATIAGMLDEGDCLEIGSTIAVGRKIKSLLRQIDKEHLSLLHFFKEKTESIESLEELQLEIERQIDPQGFIRDDASFTLRQIRQQSSSIKQKITDTLTQLLRSVHYSKMIQEQLVTMRNNRYVIPIKQEYRSMMKGIVHDQSSSGATLFIEPEAVFHLNNQLREMELDEEKERVRILTELTQCIAQQAVLIENNVDILTQLDVILAKAQWGRSHNGICPEVSSVIYLKKAKHPFISEESVVPIDVSLTDHRAMLITGPNAGGKTVILKTVGLFALMTQSGIPILAEEESQMPVYNKIFADIGDEQSIEQSLSTFSGHLTNIIKILTHLDERSLILLDELGAGTDPAEGTALATSILEYIIAKGCTTITTTHYSELKYFAYNHCKVVNASVEFDVESLSPTYRLIIGTPGSSNAFAISERLGLPKVIINNAKVYLSDSENSFDKGIEQLQRAKQEAEDERDRERTVREKCDALYEDLQKKVNQWETQRCDLEEQARIRAQRMIDQAEREVNDVLKQLEQLKSSPNTKKHHLIEAKTRLRKVVPESSANEVQKKSHMNTQEIDVGDEVVISHLRQDGIIVEKLSDEEFVVQMGIVKMKLKRLYLEKKAQKAPSNANKTVYSITRSDEAVRPELHLRGKLIEEALQELDKYLDDVVFIGYKKVAIVHGKGTGALRVAVQSYLRQHRSVKEFRLGYYGEGGEGVTIVELN